MIVNVFVVITLLCVLNVHIAYAEWTSVTLTKSVLESYFNSSGSLTNVLSIYLGYNYLTSLDGSVFSSLTKLKSIDLSYNNISSIASSVFSSLTSLESVWLISNPIVSNNITYVRNLCSSNNKCTLWCAMFTNCIAYNP